MCCRMRPQYPRKQLKVLPFSCKHILLFVTEYKAISSEWSRCNGLLANNTPLLCLLNKNNIVLTSMKSKTLPASHYSIWNYSNVSW